MVSGPLPRLARRAKTRQSATSAARDDRRSQQLAACEATHVIASTGPTYRLRRSVQSRTAAKFKDRRISNECYVDDVARVPPDGPAVFVSRCKCSSRTKREASCRWALSIDPRGGRGAERIAALLGAIGLTVFRLEPHLMIVRPASDLARRAERQAGRKPCAAGDPAQVGLMPS